MKRYLPGILSVVALLLAVFSVASNAGAGRQQQVSVQEGTPSFISYQGQVTVDGKAYTGPGYFKFAVVDNTDATTWSNDATSLNGSEPTAPVTLTVSNGLFTVLLGDPNLGMSPIGADVFTPPSTFLRVWFRSSAAAPFERLDPDRPIAAVPYALQAAIAQQAKTVSGYSSSQISIVGHPHAGEDIISGTVAAAYIDATIARTSDIVAGYVNLTGTQTITGTKIFNPVAGAPFSVTTSITVTNLNADQVDSRHGTDLQARVINTCAVGSTIRAINVDGSVVCENYFTREASLTVNTIQSSATVTNGQYSSIAIGADGLPLISFYEDTGTGGYLKVAHCGSLDCSPAHPITITTLDGAAGIYAGQYSSLAIGADGYGVISYYYASSTQIVKVADCGDADCSKAAARLVSIGLAGPSNTSIAIDAAGRPLISFYRDNDPGGQLMVAHCSNASCSGGTIASLDGSSSSNRGQYSSLAIGADGLGLISYYDASSGSLKVAHCADSDCASTDATTTFESPGTVGQYTSIAIGADGLGLISYYDSSLGQLRIAHCQNRACSVADLAVLDSSGNVGRYTSLTLGADGLGLISYYDATNSNLKVAKCLDLACTQAIIVPTGIAADNVEGNAAITLGADGLPIISYISNNSLNVAHCGNGLCSPYLWRR